MTFVEFLPFLGVLIGAFIYFVAKDPDRPFSESAGMALGAALALVSLAAVGAYLFDTLAGVSEQACNIRIPDITLGQ